MSGLLVESNALGGARGALDQHFMDPCDVRTAFTIAMSTMYRSEVPLYGDLIRIVQGVNASTLSQRQQVCEDLLSQRLDMERHGAIRLGTPYELRTVSRLFSLLGLRAVGYYDLSVAGLPMHATCFRPIDQASLDKNPFRVFTTLLRPELISDEEARKLATKLLARRNIFSDRLLDLMNEAESHNGRIKSCQLHDFITEAMKTFSWRPEASASAEEYKVLAAEHPILADIASFKSSHINHLTPRTLDITASQEQMRVEGLKVKDYIEQPPLRKCPILLRQTSFLALEERIKFLNREGSLIEGTHRARFGEIEERGAAVTPAGRELYDRLLDNARGVIDMLPSPKKPEEVEKAMLDAFEEYPDDWDELRKQGLIYCTYNRTGEINEGIKNAESLQDLISGGYLRAQPITYEDFLPFSAAGIFSSNLGSSKRSARKDNPQPDQAGFESALGYALLDSNSLYLKAQRESIERCVMGLSLIKGYTFGVDSL